MRLATLLVPAVFGASAVAADANSSSSSSSSASASAASPAAASPSTSDPTPLGALWTSSWTSASLTPYTRHCHSTATFRASIYKLSELYPTLETFAPELKVFYNKQLYPGSWSGHDAHGNGRELLKMRYADLPFAVREWLRKTKTQRHFSVQEDYVFFAPGAVYPRLPLFVDEAEGPECEGLFEDLDNYSNELEDGKVVGQLTHEMKGENEVEVTIEVFQVKKAKAAEEDARDEL